MHTGNLQPCTDVVGSVCKCTLEAFVFQQLEPKNTQQHVSLSELLTSLIVQFHQLHVNQKQLLITETWFQKKKSAIKNVKMSNVWVIFL